MARGYKVLSIIGVLFVVTLSSFGVVLSHNSACRVPEPVAADGARMKAIVYHCYGPPEVLKLEDIAKPAAVDDRMLVRVHAASVNPLDWHFMRGTPYVMRAMSGLGTPKSMHMGVDFAGTVESVGKNVKRFKPGDEVFGGRDGAFGEYVSVRENGSVALKPANLTFEQAAAVPIAGITALQALRDKGQVRAGQHVLINGASGGVGTFAVQIAKAFGAVVTGVCSTRNLEMVRSIGADQVVDYTREDFTEGSKRYDLIVDTVGTHSLAEYRRVLNPNGVLVIVGAVDKGLWLGALSGALEPMLASHFGTQKYVFMLAEMNKEDLGVLGDLMQTGKLTPVIDKRYSLREVPEAMGYLEQGHARGKVVITLD